MQTEPTSGATPNYLPSGPFSYFSCTKIRVFVHLLSFYFCVSIIFVPGLPFCAILDSRSGTPQNARKSPTSDMGIQNRENQSGGANKERNQRNNQRNNNQQQQRERRDSGRNELQENKGGFRVSWKFTDVIRRF